MVSIRLDYVSATLSLEVVTRCFCLCLTEQAHNMTNSHTKGHNPKFFMQLRDIPAFYFSVQTVTNEEMSRLRYLFSIT